MTLLGIFLGRGEDRKECGIVVCLPSAWRVIGNTLLPTISTPYFEYINKEGGRAPIDISHTTYLAML